MSETKRWLVLALGNPLQGDDGFGRAVLKRLARDARVGARADLSDAGTDLLGQIERFADREQVVLIDTLLDGGRAPGEIVVLEHELVAGLAVARGGSAHAASAVEAVELFRTLHPRSATRIRWVLLRTDRLESGAGRSAPSAADAGADAVRTLLAADPGHRTGSTPEIGVQ